MVCEQHDISTDCVFLHAIELLQQPDPQQKASGTRRVAELWTQNRLSTAEKGCLQPPDRPGRDDSKVKVVAPGKMHRLGKGGSLASRKAILHSLVHIESWAVDLSWDTIARFGSNPSYELPDAFISDFIQVAVDEASHFQCLQERLEALGSGYGALPVHDGLWESAAATAHSLPARLAVESCVHEARGLDRLPLTIQKFQKSGDHESVKLLEQIYQEEIAHCAAGVRWLTYLHQQANAPAPGQKGQTTTASAKGHQEPNNTYAAAAEASAVKDQQSSIGAVTSQLQAQTMQQTPSNIVKSAECSADRSCEWRKHARQYRTVEEWFHALVLTHFKGSLKPPFNVEARAAAGFGPDWYLPLAA